MLSEAPSVSRCFVIKIVDLINVTVDSRRHADSVTWAHESSAAEVSVSFIQSSITLNLSGQVRNR